MEIKKAEAPAEVPRKKVQSKQDYQQRKEAERAVRKTKNEIDRVEARISELEAEIAEWDRRMADPAANGIDLGDPSVFETYNGLKQTLAARMHDWEKLNYELDLLTEQV